MLSREICRDWVLCAVHCETKMCYVIAVISECTALVTRISFSTAVPLLNKQHTVILMQLPVQIARLV